MNIDDLLKQAGLSQSERVVYLAGAGRDYSTAEFVAKLDLPRSTITAALRELQNFRLCTPEPIDLKSYRYRMEPLSKLNSYLSDQASELSNLMESISTLPQNSPSLVTKQVIGQEAVQELLELALRCKTRKWQIIAAKDNPIRFMPKNYTTYFKNVRNERQIESLSLWDSQGKRSVGLHDLLMRKPRYVPTNVSTKIPGLLLAYDDSLLMLEGKSSPQAVLIENTAIAQTFRIIFEMAWRHVKPPL